MDASLRVTGELVRIDSEATLVALAKVLDDDSADTARSAGRPVSLDVRFDRRSHIAITGAKMQQRIPIGDRCDFAIAEGIYACLRHPGRGRREVDRHTRPHRPGR
jgi:hypothetical protein